MGITRLWNTESVARSARWDALVSAKLERIVFTARASVDYVYQTLKPCRQRLPNLETLSTTFTKPWNLVDNVYQTLKPCRLRLPNLETLSTTFTKPWNLVDNAYQTLKPCRQRLPNLETLSTTFTKPWNLVDYVYQILKPCRLRLPTGTLNNVVNAFLLRWLDTSAWYSGCHKCILDSLRKLDSSTWYTGCHKCILTKMVR